MIIENGTLQIVKQDDGDFFDGVPNEEARTLDEPMPCNISGKSKRDNRNGDNSYTSAEYEVIINNMSVFDAAEVVLNDRRRCLGTFRVEDTQYLEYVDAIKLTCVRYAD